MSAQMSSAPTGPGLGASDKTTSKHQHFNNNKLASTPSTSSTTTCKGIMSAIAAKILGKDHHHIYREVEERHRLSYADLDKLLDREEHELLAAQERERQLKAGIATPTTTTTTTAMAGETAVAVEGSMGSRSSSSSSSGSEDEADWHFNGEHEEDLLLELEESSTDSILTVSGAEDHLVKEIDHIVHDDITDVQLERMKKLLNVNCLHRGEIESVRGKRWLVAVDGSEASRRAWTGALKMLEPEDHLLVVTVRDKNLPRKFALSPSEETQLRFELWKSARHIVKPFMDEVAKRLAPSQYTVMIPDAWDARRMLCNLCKRYNVDTLCVGKHAKGEHNHHHHHLRSLHSYTSKHAHCQVIVF